MRASAATSGAYILMFEKTSDPAYNAQKRNYVFNDSVSEKLEGMIYGASRISLVVNTLIVNSANWTFEGIGAGGTNVSGFYLSR